MSVPAAHVTSGERMRPHQELVWPWDSSLGLNSSLCDLQTTYCTATQHCQAQSCGGNQRPPHLRHTKDADQACRHPVTQLLHIDVASASQLLVVPAIGRILG